MIFSLKAVSFSYSKADDRRTRDTGNQREWKGKVTQSYSPLGIDTPLDPPLVTASNQPGYSSATVIQESHIDVSPSFLSGQ